MEAGGTAICGSVDPRTGVSVTESREIKAGPVSRGWDVVDAGAVGTAGQRKQRQGCAHTLLRKLAPVRAVLINVWVQVYLGSSGAEC